MSCEFQKGRLRFARVLEHGREEDIDQSMIIVQLLVKSPEVSCLCFEKISHTCGCEALHQVEVIVGGQVFLRSSVRRNPLSQHGGRCMKQLALELRGPQWARDLWQRNLSTDVIRVSVWLPFMST